MYRITRSISFCYGHRLLGHAGKCRHLHGHNARAVVTLEDGTLDEQGMLVDFYELGSALKGWIDGELDHTMILCRKDPLVPLLQKAGERILVVDWNPTAELLARMIFERVAAAGYPVRDVTLWETETCSASYRADPSRPAEERDSG